MLSEVSKIPTKSGRSRKAGKTIFIVIACLVILLFTNFSFANLNQGNWRWRNDDGDVYSATWKDSLNTPVILTYYNNIRLRIETTFDNKDTSNISLSYSEDPFKSPWIPLTRDDTGKFFISPSKYLFDTVSYLDNRLLPKSDHNYQKTITFDSTNNFLMIAENSSKYELEYSLKPTLKLQPGCAYFFSLIDDYGCMGSLNATDYAVLMTPPVNWINQSFEKKYWDYILLNNVFFVDSNIGTAVGKYRDGRSNEGLILKTADGGKNWVSQASGTTTTLYGVSFTDANNGTVVGDLGTILRTTNGGESWIKQISNTTYQLYSVCYASSDTGTVVGSYCDISSSPYKYNNIILRTTNGGITWTKQLCPTNEPLHAVYFIDSETGTAVGDSGTILRTTNGGQNWIVQSSGTDASLKSVFFTDANNGTAVGYPGIILRTTDGGKNWWKSLNSNAPRLSSVYFIDKNTGWVVGEYGYILKTIDGGLNWQKLVSETSVWLTAVYFTDSKTGWVVGGNGKILKTTNGGITTSVDEKKSESIPQQFFLSQNYPNPFNPSTMISYQLPMNSQVTLKVYDILGNEVTTLVNEVKTAGTYEVKFNGSKLSSGIYFYQLKTGDYSEVKKMILIK